MRRVRRIGRVAAAAGFLLASAIAIVLLIKGLYPADLPETQNPDFVDNVFDNRGVLWAARLLLVSAAGVLAFGGTFIVVSIGIRMKNGEWLRRAGPFEISEGSLGQASDEVEFWRRTAQASRQEALESQGKLRRSDKLIRDLR